jgi:hypothetical protein
LIKPGQRLAAGKALRITRPRKGLEGLRSKPRPQGGAGAIAQPWKARFLPPGGGKNAPKNREKKPYNYVFSLIFSRRFGNIFS